jgi:hypothetical protein
LSSSAAPGIASRPRAHGTLLFRSGVRPPSQ